MTNLRIVDQPPLIRFISKASDMVTIDMYNVTDYYTERPDGTWYQLQVMSTQSSSMIQKFIDSGMEPYQAFEMAAL